VSSCLLASFSDGSDCAVEGVFGRAGSAGDSSRQQLLIGACGLASELSLHGGHCINLCDDRYYFTLGFSAALVAGMTNLLPANRQLETVLQVAAQHPDSVLLHDSSLDSGLLERLQRLGIPLWNLRDLPQSTNAPPPRLEILANHHAATVFTSGSTGQPVGIRKTWRALTGTTRLLCERILPHGARVSLVATVPPQHMYGLETTVMMALHGNCWVHSGRPFFPVDIVQALADMPPPRILVTTPIHLKALLQSGLTLPDLHSVISATAPLSLELAQQAEERWKCQVTEIYGCSEAGSLASRRTIEGDTWLTLEGVTLDAKGDVPLVRAAHLDEPVELQDQLEIGAPGQFRLMGRNADMLNIGGKRASLHQLTAQLLAVEGVSDGVVFLRDEDPQPDHLTGLAALVVRDRSQQAISRDLLKQIDPVFLPRPMRRVNALPRNAVGKCTKSALLHTLHTTAPGEREDKG